MLSMQKVVYSSVKFGMLDEFQTKVSVQTYHALPDILKVHLSSFMELLIIICMYLSKQPPFQSMVGVMLCTSWPPSNFP